MTRTLNIATGGDAAPETVDHAQYIDLLSAVPVFASLPHEALADLVGLATEECFVAGAIVVAEGEIGDRLYVIAQGEVEVTIARPTGPVPLSKLGPGEQFGELALILPGGRRRATVTALSAVVAVSIPGYAFQRLLELFPEARAACEKAAELMLAVGFLRQAGPFTCLDAARLHALAAQLEHLEVSAGATIIEQGDVGDTCYLLRTGSVEVLRKEDGAPERRLATVGSGAVIGEIALLVSASRTATVKALEPCSFLVIHRDDLLAALDANPSVRSYMLDLLQLRQRPRQMPGVQAYHRIADDGATVTILKDVQRRTYYRLSPEGWFLWQRLDGQHSLRDLTMDFLEEFRLFAPQTILDLLGRLAVAGFVTAPDLRPDVGTQQHHPARMQRLLLRARGLLEWHVALSNVDATVTQLYRGGVYILYIRLAQIVLLAVAAAGLIAFLTHPSSMYGHRSVAGGAPLLAGIAGFLVSVVAHEAGHAFTTKAFGHEVHRAGVGWYWFGPVAFVDTTDMWLAGRWPRIAVSLAGPYTNLLLGSIAALIAWAVPQSSVATVLWPAALASYLLVLANLNPLLEYDGYYVVMDLLDRPNLRTWALAWLGSSLLPALRRPALLRGHAVELVFGLGSLLYVALMAVLTVVLYRLLVQGWLAHVLPATAAFALAWVAAALVAVLAAAGAVGGLRGTRREPAGDEFRRSSAAR